jgi:hypothetical protein
MFVIIARVYTGSCEISVPESCVAVDSSLLGQDAVYFRKYLPSFRKKKLVILCCSYPEDYCSKLLRNSGVYLQLDTKYPFQLIMYRFIFVCFSQEQSEPPINVFIHNTVYLCCQPALYDECLVRDVSSNKCMSADGDRGVVKLSVV